MGCGPERSNSSSPKSDAVNELPGLIVLNFDRLIFLFWLLLGCDVVLLLVHFLLRGDNLQCLPRGRGVDEREKNEVDGSDKQLDPQKGREKSLAPQWLLWVVELSLGMPIKYSCAYSVSCKTRPEK
eukprot:scaffold4052_cov213-Amphora_coffeaeformis.AAC.13